MKKRLWLKRTLWTFLVLFVVMNIIAALHAWSFTHFTDTADAKSSTDDNALWLALTGVKNPRPTNSTVPNQPYESVIIEGENPTACWLIKTDSAIGTVVVCHGYGGCKSSMLDKADEFLTMNYNVLLPDFMGCGDSEGDQCTIGFYESKQVTACCNYLAEQGEENVILFGTSMGAVALMKSLSEDSISATCAIIECPFGSMYETTCARFDMMGIPSFPMAGLLVFWGGAENGFWAFDHNPTEYAKRIKIPVLLMYGEKDPKVSRAEIDEIYSNLPGTKQLVTFAQAGHENYLNQYRMPWLRAVNDFLRASYLKI
jgi:pimeloyl-ACP methyl ester carboxylesterase